MSDQRAATRVVRPDLIGWEAIAAHLGVKVATARRWHRQGMPVFSWGPTQVAAYGDKIVAWAMSARRAA